MSLGCVPMNQEEFFNKLNEITTADLHVYGESGRKLTDRERRDGRTPTIYSAKNITDLFSRVDKDDRRIRFVIDKEGQPFFGEMGPLKGSTPGHEEMSNGLCLAAGTLALSADYKIVTGISYRSGFFKPTMNSLFWGLKYLFSVDSVFQLSSTLSVAYFPDQTPTDEWIVLSLDTEALRAVVEPLLLISTNFSADSAELFISYKNEAPKVHMANGITCAGSFNDLTPLTQQQPQSGAQTLVSQAGMFAPANNIAGIAAVHDDYDLTQGAFSDEEEDDLIFSPFKISRVS